MKVIVDGLAIEYEDEGNGPTLLMLHGWQDNLRTFDALVENLKNEYRIIRLDLPGFGKSDMPKETWNLSRYVDFTSDFIKKLNLSVYSLVGHSFGGRIVIKGVSENKLQSEKNILLASAGIASTASFRNKILKLCAKIVRPILFIPPLSFWREKIRYKFYAKVGSDYANAGTLQKTFVEVVSEDLQESAKKILQPTLLLYGENDESTPVYYGLKFAKNMKKSDLHVIKGASHFVHQEKTEDVVQLIRNFIKQ